MQIDWLHFSPWTALCGGALIGLASAFLLLATSRIAGISGIVGGLLRTGSSDAGWRLAFVGGLLAAPVLWQLLVPGGLLLPHLFLESPEQLLVLAFAGLLVGLGTQLAKGCTSGHGICGLARFSRRSLVAVVIFMATAMVVVFITHHVPGVGV